MRTKAKTAVKICGVTQSKQAIEIASLGANAIGVIGVKSSKRFLSSKKRTELFGVLTNNFPHIERVWVVANPTEEELIECLTADYLPTVVQLHGSESQEMCKKLKEKYPYFKWWKALRISCKDDLLITSSYEEIIDSILLDSWHIRELGGTGNRLPIEWLIKMNFQKPWWIAGGVSAEWIPLLLSKTAPYGIDASSKLESSPGIKDMKKVRDLLKAVQDQ